MSQISTPNSHAPKTPARSKGDGGEYCGYSQARGKNTIGITTKAKVPAAKPATVSTPMRSPFGKPNKK